MRRLLPLLIIAALATGCTDDSNDADSTGAENASTPPSSSATPVPTGPACETVWKVGDTLDQHYELCVEDGAAGIQDVIECAEGTPLIVFDNELFGRPGEEIRESKESPVQDTKEFAKVYSECTGE